MQYDVYYPYNSQSKIKIYLRRCSGMCRCFQHALQDKNELCQESDNTHEMVQEHSSVQTLSCLGATM